MYVAVSSLFVWPKRCCRNAPASDQLRVGSGAGDEPAPCIPTMTYETSDDVECSTDITISINVRAVLALHIAKADRLTEHLASRGKAAQVLPDPISWLTYSPTRTMTLLFLIVVPVIFSVTEIEDVGFSMNTTSDITDESDMAVLNRLGRRIPSLRQSGHSVSGDSRRDGKNPATNAILYSWQERSKIHGLLRHIQRYPLYLLS